MPEVKTCANCRDPVYVGPPPEVKPDDAAYLCPECGATLCIYCCLSHECGPHYKRQEEV